MVAQNIFFYVIAAVMAFSAIRVVTVKNVVHAAMYLVLVLAGVAAQYVLLASEFLAATQVLIYIGAIVVLVLFGVMLTRAKLGEDVNLTNDYWYVGAFTGVILFVLLATSLLDHFGDEPLDQANASTQISGNTEQVADALFAPYLVPFQAVSVLLLAALVGAIALARKD
ncbi:NADH-quinone oxidoreductase subunit J [Acidimicrobiia bacterium EGI L10123]|uniref:NADH-quinone oxidoreductase subunit J family protein n=1 Tax=Salinilacustrithrix flava TaxID=2957203 RepID=UPI003D7C24EF|nr:NADH-quinone oxidoreductase subunit J [Acidimicrobiia bacterium EGI L10123]